jgi:nitroreductase
MTLEEILRRRHSVRAFDSRPVRPEDIVALGEAARLAPSACNSQTWRFIAVTDRRLIDRICDEATRPIIRNEFLRQAPLVIVGCSQLDIVANRVGTAITGIEYFRIDLGIAMEHMVLRATELGLGTCWIGWFRERRVKRILGIPRRIRVSAMLAVGHPASEESRAHARRPLSEILFAERWGEPLGAIDRGGSG